ncbi:alpha/beta fold hydrolase [Cohnella thailandensis]|uniref:Alpha/beta hydrolase n=1 Tax=Cohnella thailandensis TaxID=557557 RepID=A0A841T2Q2_9BACL|nr:alpha/beta hydrolase [Cohnella thailandensis]MBB6636648.1 alpha/beta hydrolase [Cohnella thailandensis]MBP1973476.1 N-formylmaleamate deformylase [Cohnella thailandensis]
MGGTGEIRDIRVTGAAGELRLLAAGNPQGRPVLFLHGITENAQAFVPIMRELPDDLYVLSLDLRGRGQSVKPSAGYGVLEYAQDLLYVWNHFSGNAEKPVLVGHSMGGRAACAFAALYPQLVGAAVLIDPPISGPGRPAFPLPIGRFLEPKRALEAGDIERFRSYYAAPGFDYERKANELRECSEEAILHSYEAMNRDPFHAYYRMLKVPALLITAGGSPLIPKEAEDELRRMNPLVAVVRYEDVGHEIHKLAPERLTQELIRYLTSLT